VKSVAKEGIKKNTHK